VQPVRHPNKITEMRWRASQQMPPGSREHHSRHVHNPRQGRSSRTRDYRGPALVAWFIENGQLDEAETLLNQLIEQEGEQK